MKYLSFFIIYLMFVIGLAILFQQRDSNWNWKKRIAWYMICISFGIIVSKIFIK